MNSIHENGISFYVPSQLEQEIPNQSLHPNTLQNSNMHKNAIVMPSSGHSRRRPPLVQTLLQHTTTIQPLKNSHPRHQILKLYHTLIKDEGTHRLVHGPTGTKRPLGIVVQPIPHGAAPVPERLERPHGSLLGRHLAAALLFGFSA